MDIKCENCINYRNELRNMIGMRNIYCAIGIQKMEANCEAFVPTPWAANFSFLKELYDNFIDLKQIEFKRQSHYWRLVNDGNIRSYKRYSGNSNFVFKFNTEDQLEEFYNHHKEIIQNANLK